jgi:hypothetical protein
VSHGTSPWRSNMIVGTNITIWTTLQMGRTTFIVCHQTVGPHCNGNNRVNEGFFPIATRCKRFIAKLSIYLVMPCPENTFANRESEPIDSLILHSAHCVISLYRIVVSKLLPEIDIFNPKHVCRPSSVLQRKLLKKF